MATLIKRRISLSIKYNKNDPGNLIWQARADCVTPDDKSSTGEEQFSIATDPNVVTRTTFRALTGAQIEAQVIAALNDKLQNMGTGAGGHTLQDDYGT